MAGAKFGNNKSQGGKMSEVKEEIPLGKREHYPNVGKYIADCLKEQEVEVVFGVPGGHLWQIWDEISNAGIKMVLMRHEQAGVYAAELFASDCPLQWR
jgi:hypothetical protein